MALREQMLEMLDSTRVEEEVCEISGDLLVAVSLCRMNRSNVYIVAENDLHAYVRILKSYGLNVHRVVCSKPKEFSKVDDIEIVSPQDLLTDMTPRKFFICFTDSCPDVQTFFITQIDTVPAVEKSNMLFVVQPYNAQRLNLNSIDEYDANSMFYYQSHKAELMELFDSLADETSKRALFYYVESYVRNCVYRGEQNPTMWRYFFGGKHERLYKHLDGEVWINCGANEGDTVFQYLSFDFKPKKIYAFEGDTEIYGRMLNNLELLPPVKRALVEPINEMIDASTDFEKILAGDKCTLINADIEGAELPFLHATERIIRADRPVIAVCLYHLKEDLLTVPQFLQSICVDYVWYIRKYTPYLLSVKKVHELVFYAVPKERALR
ncbi:MAG: hypothetical protein IJ774_06555 [Selenomonadaceae bacterium]|nr:hypothetical protein [Selenomonadaceae bacterium]